MKRSQSRRRFLKLAAAAGIAGDAAMKSSQAGVPPASFTRIRENSAQNSDPPGGDPFPKPANASLPSSASDAPWKRSYVGLPNVVGETEGVPVYGYGRVFVYGVSPDFDSGAVIQQNNAATQRKLKPKKSWEISENYCGSMVSYQPREPKNDFQPCLAANLIDGDPNTFWMTRGEGQPDVRPAWVRIDLAAEERLHKVVLNPVKQGGAWPKELTVKLSQDAWHWTDVYDGNPFVSLKADQPLQINLHEPLSAKQIWILANHLPFIGLASVSGQYRFALSGIEAIDDKGRNAALISRGAGVTVSSTFTTVGGTWDLCDQLWPVQYDLGATWMRLSGSNPPEDFDTLLWRFVEREPGKYIGDEKTRRAMAEATANGYKVDVQLAWGNWLYASPPQTEYGRWDIGKYPYPFTPAPITKEAFEGFKNFARFMAGYYKGAVAYWEVYDEAIGWGWDAIKNPHERVRRYCDLVRTVARTIREADPYAKISLAGMNCGPIAKPSGLPEPEWATKSPNDWLYKCLDLGIGPVVDTIGWHIQGSLVPGTPYWEQYPGAVRAIKRYAESKGFRGKYLASEYWMGAPYPVESQTACAPQCSTSGYRPISPGSGNGASHPDAAPDLTEACKAKDAARVFVMNAGLGVVTFWCNTWIPVPLCDGGLFRNGYAADPVIPMQPEPAYYVLRTVCTVLDGAEPASVKAEFSNKDHKIEYYGFRLSKGDLMIGAWLPGKSVDKHPGVTTDITTALPTCRQVVGIDTLNGTEQELDFKRLGGRSVISKVVIHDYPLMLRFHIETKGS